MIGKIKRLTSSTIDKIAAGEVIENPASVVKELVENAIDAGALNITIEVQNGGYQSIRIVDDGEGMVREDALICFERHATSKLKGVDDFASLQTMGFRGEALSSIASISRFSLLTKHRDAKEEAPATQIVIDGQIQLKEAARKRGTTIDVEALFYNVPARKKFQKSVAASMSEITKVVTKLSLAFPNVTFKLIANGEPVITAIASRNGTFEEHLALRIRDVLPSNYVEKGCRIEYEDDLIKIYGMVGLPSESRLNRAGQYLFINQRAVYSHLISGALQEAFSTRLETREHPIFVLQITVDPSYIDVNVHPQKREVRLSHEKELVMRLKRAALQALAKHEKIKPGMDESIEIDFDPIDMPQDFAPFEKMAFQETPYEQVSFFSIQPEARIKPLMTWGGISIVDTPAFNEVFSKHAFDPGLLFCDHQNIARRLAYDTLYKSLTGKKEKMPIQALLFPITLEFSHHESMMLVDILPLLDKLGIGMRSFGKNCFIIESLTAFFEQQDMQKLITDLIETIGHRQIEEMRLKHIAEVASRYVNRIQTDLHMALVELMQSASPFLSPTGQPTLGLVRHEDFPRFFEEFPCHKKG
ncbi:MAG: DNA mismatch repair endonuclease MutL [Simkaniaceae bacterium]|nr:DNA mismatch repair endonuclease MutL [Simkaniaceae bacterium]MCF7851987.1 DNA mismatch repair endonuclease MutL [Simkaniaceae bacterium]